MTSDEQIAQLQTDRALLMGAVMLVYPRLFALLEPEEKTRMTRAIQRHISELPPEVTVAEIIRQMAIRMGSEEPA